MSNGGPMSFRKAAAALGMGDSVASENRLRRLVLAREKTTGQTIATRGQGKQRPIRGVSLRAIYRHLPELRPEPKTPTSTLVGQFRKYLEEIDEKLRVVAREEADAAIQETVTPQLDELREQDQATLEMLNELAARVAATAGVKKSA